MIDTDIIDENGDIVRKQFTVFEKINMATQAALLKCSNIDDVHICWKEMEKEYAKHGENILLGPAEKVAMLLQAFMVENFGELGAVEKVENFFLEALARKRSKGARNVRGKKLVS